MKKKNLSIVQLSIVIVLGLMVLAPMAVSADSPNPKPKILPVDSKPYGLSYGDWSAKWWQWAFSMPVNKHPLFDTADCSVGQSGNVWFLGASFTPTPINGVYHANADRTCNVPAEKAIFFPVANSEASTLEDNGVTYEELLANATIFQGAAANLSAEIDGVAIQNLNRYRVQSQLFTFGPLPSNNVLQFLYRGTDIGTDSIKGTISNSVADGVYLMVAPMSAGNHKIHFHADFGPGFILDINYNLNVVAS